MPRDRSRPPSDRSARPRTGGGKGGGPRKPGPGRPGGGDGPRGGKFGGGEGRAAKGGFGGGAKGPRAARGSYEDRPARGRSDDRPARGPGGEDRPRKPRGEGRFEKAGEGRYDRSGEGRFEKSGEGRVGDRPPRREGGEHRKPRDFEDRPARGEGRFEKAGEGRVGDRPPRREGGEFRKPREGGEFRKPRDRDESGFGERPARGPKRFEDRPPRSRGDFGDRPPRREGGEYRKPREGGEFRKPREGGEFRKPREGGEFRKPREGGEYRKPREGGRFDKPPREGEGFDRRRRFEDGPPREGGFTTEAAEPAAPKRPKLGLPPTHLLYGLHAVRAALMNEQRTLKALYVTDAGLEALIGEDALELTLEPELIEKDEMDRLAPTGAVHQGVLLVADPLPEVGLEDVVAGTADAEDVILIVLDQITDPQNVGAIMRSAAAFGAVAVIEHRRHGPEVTATMAKAASGAVELVPLVQVTNLARAIDELKEAGFTCIGLAEEGQEPIGALDLTGKLALVIGAEGEGMRRLTMEKCSAVAVLPTAEDFSTLNASASAAIALYEARRQRG